MSRIGRLPIPLPSGVKIDVKGTTVKVVGPKGELSIAVPDGITIKHEDSELLVERRTDEKKHKSLHGLIRALLANMVEGTSNGFTKVLEIVGTGYRAEELGGEGIRFNLGYSNPVDFTLLKGVTAVIEERGTRLTLSGIDKQAVGETAARIRRLRPPDSYKGKGIRYSGEQLRLKAGKSGVKG